MYSVIKGTLALCLLAAACTASAQARMTWMLPDFPPVSMPVDGRPGDGITHALLKFIVARWDGQDHHYVIANSKRIWRARS
jgi:hypothetical protein